MARQPGLHHELVLVDQSKLRQRQRELHASHQQSLTRLPLELLNGLPQIPAHELRVPIDPVQGARHDVLLCRVDSDWWSRVTQSTTACTSTWWKAGTAEFRNGSEHWIPLPHSSHAGLSRVTRIRRSM